MRANPTDDFFALVTGCLLDERWSPQAAARAKSGIPAAGPAAVWGNPPAVYGCGAPGCSAGGVAGGTRQMLVPVLPSPEECLQAEDTRERERVSVNNSRPGWRVTVFV